MKHELNMDISKAPKGSSGFSLVEISVVVAIFLILAGSAIPYAVEMVQTNRLLGDARSLAHELSLARLRAGTDFTWAEVAVNSAVTPNSYSLKLCTTKATSSCTTFTAEGGKQYLSSGISFGFGSSSGPAGGQTAATQTATVTFNSRGIPIDSGGSPTANDTIYLADNDGHAYAVSATLSGHIKIYHYTGGAWVSL